MIKQAVGDLPVLCTGGFQNAALDPRGTRARGSLPAIDGVSMARPLVANNDLVQYFERGEDLPPKPCTFCNKCLVNDLENPLGCYEIDRFDGNYQAMMDQVMSVFYPSPYCEKKSEVNGDGG